MVSENPKAINFLDEKDPEFAGLRGVRDRVAKELWSAGIGVADKHTEGISYDEEQLLWSEGVLGFDNPRMLLNTVFFYNGKVLILRGGREHQELKFSQFSFGAERGKNYIQFVEMGSKNRSGSYKSKHSNKVIKHYADPSLGKKCYYYILSFYWQKVHKHYDGNCFYLQPCPHVPKESDRPWFLCQPIGRSTLDGMVSKMCNTVGIKGKTNHSLRVTETTRLFNAHVLEKIVQERSGHLSLESLRCYERASPKQHENVSSILSSSSPLVFSKINENEKCVKVEDDTRATFVKDEDTKLFKKEDSPQNIHPTFSACKNCTINVNFQLK
uniref:ZMYM2-like/QRICH1 C-terminal domain-containing protein n=1 Tax=Amphimedon queenslandica TaxID=400682 RepID=A0A1X7UMI5_AMPQE